MNLVVKQYGDVSAERWNTFVLSNSMGWAYHLHDVVWLHWHPESENRSFAIVDSDNGDEIVLLMMLHKMKLGSEQTPRRRARFHIRFSRWVRSSLKQILSKKRDSRIPQQKAYLTSQWGYVVKDKLPGKQARKLREVFEEYLDALMVVEDAVGLEVTLPPLSNAMLAQYPSPVSPMMELSISPGIRYTYVVNLSKADERLLADCNETTRQAIRKISKANRYEIVEAADCQEDVDTYIQLHRETYIRTNGLVKDDSYHHNIFHKLLPQGIARVFMLKERETGKVVAAISIIIHPNKTAYYWWGHSRDEKEVGVNKYFLFRIMEIIRESFGKQGFFEVGGAWPDLRSGKFKGLNDFKKSFGGVLYPIFTGSFNHMEVGKEAALQKLQELAGKGE